MRVLVLGGTRFIGVAVVERLLARGCDVAVFHRGEAEEKEAVAGVTHIHGDRARMAEHRADFEAWRPDVLLDMAAMMEADAVATMGVARGLVPRVVVVSSADVYRAYGRLHGSEPGPVEPMPLLEDAPLREKLFPYRGERRDGRLDDYDKIPVERTVMSDPEIAGTVVRLPAVYGECDYQHRLFMEVRRFDAKRPFLLWQKDALTWRWSRGYVGNAGEAIALAVTGARAAGRIYNAPPDPPLSQEKWLREYGRVAGWEGRIIGLPDDLLPPHLKSANNYAQDVVTDGSRMRTGLGYEDIVPWEEGIRRAMEWERAHPPERINPRVLDFALEDAAEAAWRAGAS